MEESAIISHPTSNLARPRLAALLLAALLLAPGCDESRESIVSPYAGEKVAPAPPGWRPPPPIGTPGYDGPPPDAPMRMSPYAAAVDRGVRRQHRLTRTDDDLLRARLQAHLAGRPGRILFIGRKPEPEDDFGPLHKRFVDWRRQAELPPLLRALAHEGDAEPRLAATLQGLGVRWLLIDRYVVPTVGWLDERADAILHRLSWSHPLDWFHPALIGRTYVLYRIAPPFKISAAQGRAIVAYARAALAGRKAPPWPALDLPPGAGGSEFQEVAVSLRKRSAVKVPGKVRRGTRKDGRPRYRRAGLRGRRVIIRWTRAPTVRRALDAALAEVRVDWPDRRANARKRYGVDLPAEVADAVGGMELEIDVVFDRAEITERTGRRLHEAVELGWHGLFLEFTRDGKEERHRLPPAYPIQRLDYGDTWDRKGQRTLVQHLTKEWAGLGERDWRKPEHRFGRFRARTFLEADPGGAVVPTRRATPFVPPDGVTREALVAALERGCDYLVRNQLPDGQFRYKYWAHRPRWVKGNNIVRHALNPYTVLMAQQFAPHPSKWLRAAKRGLEYTQKHVKCEGEGRARHCYVDHADPPGRYTTAKIGTVAVTILSLLRLHEFTPLSADEEQLLRHLGNHLVHMQDPNGHYRQYFVPSDHPYFGCTNGIFPGEIQFALSRLYGHTGDARYLEAFRKGFEYYRKWWQMRVGRENPDGTYKDLDRVDLVGFVPWQCMAMEDAFRQTGERQFADFALELQLWMDGHFLYTPARSPYPDYLGASFKFHGEQPAINSCGYTEGCAAAYAVARRVGRHRGLLRRNLLWGLRFALQLQYRSEATSAYFLPEPHVALGGFRYCLDRLRLRNDYSYHALSAIYQGLKFLAPEDYPARRGAAPDVPATQE